MSVGPFTAIVAVLTLVLVRPAAPAPASDRSPAPRNDAASQPATVPPTQWHAERAPRDSEITFPAMLGTFSTTLIGSLPARTQNVRLAAAALDGAVLEPGDELSFNRQVGPRTTERGYQRAPVILHETRQLQSGGGVCQVSSTLMVASLLSGLKVIERHGHSTPVDYIPMGEDATIAWGAKDLRIRNDSEQRVRLRAEVVGSTLTVRFEGEAPLDGAFDLETEEREIQGEPGTTPGREIEVYRVRRVGGEVVEREFLHRDGVPPAMPR
jgi:hypothetical protein